MGGELGNGLRRATRGQVTRRRHHDGFEGHAQPTADHVLLNRIAEPDTGIKALPDWIINLRGFIQHRFQAERSPLP
jgi:hypothetical protein